ncbi:DUF4355 domain-containing protein [Finegoldia magna]|uniref:Phage minor structural protein GP20 n=1 Tax=Finegoldia magna BVS033A4 TaxID=866773 RepID=E1KWI8_FINMA|nr:DUF4355 domain-containing protein [Finegoldia magna]EFL54699.1 hypothetical protein HMPREF9289_0727 [Finegoldia magna BVS033A4]
MEENKQIIDETKQSVDESTEKETKKDEDVKKEQSEKKYTDEDVNQIINSKFKKWKMEQEKKISEAQKLAQMDEAEKAEYERKQLEEELKKLRSEKTKSEMISVSRKMLQENNVSISDDLISSIITEDADKTKENINAFIENFNAAVEKEVNERLKSTPPKRMSNNKTLSKKDIFDVKDPVERRKLIAANMELFR